MSYDFSLQLPGASANRRAKSAPTQTIDRLARAAEILRRHEPDIEIADNEDGFTAFSAELGEVHVTDRDIVLGMSLGSDPRSVYGAIHGLMRRFAGEGYQAEDPQLMRGTVEYAPDFPTFMRQYREHFTCPTAEFEQWCRGESPPEWAARDARRQEGLRRAKELPRGATLTYQQQRELSADALWAHLQETIARNNAAIAALNLQAYLDDLATLLQARREGYRPMPSPSGRRYESLLNEDWYSGSLLQYEAQTLNVLCQRGQIDAMAYCPKRYTLTLPKPQDDTRARWNELIAALTPSLRDEDLICTPPMRMHVGLDLCATFDGPDVDAIHRVAWPRVVASGLAIEARLRYGIDGAREVEFKCGAGSP